jgi:hypothetical protein
VALATVREFQADFDVAPIADAWAAAQHWRYAGMDANGTRRYERDFSARSTRTEAFPSKWSQMLAFVTIRQVGANVHFEAGFQNGLFLRIGSLGLHPAAGGIESGGFRFGPIRRKYRGIVNPLLLQLNQPPIE